MWIAVRNIFLELAPWLLLGAFVAGLLHILLPPDWLRRNLVGRFGVLRAVLVGVPLPLCSCGVIPVGLGLRKDGASRGAVVGFLISTPQTGVDSILVSASFLGMPFALFKVAAALVTGLAGGWIADHVAEPVENADDAPANSHTTVNRDWRSAFGHALELLHSINFWLIVGVLISAALTVWLPDQALAQFGTYGGLPAMLITLVISVPLYVCATASVPIAATLVASGLPLGAAMVFLMSGPATNVATIGAVYRTLGMKSLLIYLVTIVAGSVIAGLVFEQLLATQATTLNLHHHHSNQWWQEVSAVVLAGLMLWFSAGDLRHRVRSLLTKNSTSDGADDVIVVPVEGMTCNGCAARLEKVLTGTEGVDSALVSFPDGTATVRGHATAEQLAGKIEEAGFTVGKPMSNRPV